MPEHLDPQIHSRPRHADSQHSTNCYTTPAHRHSSTSDPEPEEVTLPSPENLTAEISFSTRCSDLAKASHDAGAKQCASEPEPPRKLTRARARGLRQGAVKSQLGRWTHSSWRVAVKAVTVRAWDRCCLSIPDGPASSTPLHRHCSSAYLTLNSKL